MIKIISCKQCGTKKKIPHWYGKGIFCSKECGGLFYREDFIKNRKLQGGFHSEKHKQILIEYSKRTHFRKGMSCWRKGKKFNRITKSCINCGNSFSVQNCYKDRIVTCSNFCKRLHRHNLWFNSNNPNWQDGRLRIPYKNGFTFALKRLVKERDFNKCIQCNSKERLVVHHLDFEKFNHLINNLITLCRSCHSHIHYEKRMEAET